MTSRFRLPAIPAIICLIGVLAAPPVEAADPVENAGVGVGLTAGNLIFVPTKVFSTGVGVASAALAFLFSAGDVDLSRQILQDATQKPYWIDSEVARKAVGERPELKQ